MAGFNICNTHLFLMSGISSLCQPHASIDVYAYVHLKFISFINFHALNLFSHASFLAIISFYHDVITESSVLFILNSNYCLNQSLENASTPVLSTRWAFQSLNTCLRFGSCTPQVDLVAILVVSSGYEVEPAALGNPGDLDQNLSFLSWNVHIFDGAFSF